MTRANRKDHRKRVLAVAGSNGSFDRRNLRQVCFLFRPWSSLLVQTPNVVLLAGELELNRRTFCEAYTVGRYFYLASYKN